METIYKEIILSKNNLQIPLYKSGKPANSKYNPLQEAESFINQVSKADIYLVLGLAGAFHIESLIQRFPDSKILIVENSNEDINFLKDNIKTISELTKNKNITIFSKDKIKDNLLKNYLPSIYPTLLVLELRSWVNELGSQIENIKNEIKNTIEVIKSDFSTQAEFGKLWQHNILKNIAFMNSNIKIELPITKTALIVAAGPSLDDKIEDIIKNRDNFFIIATDTAYYSLLKRNIFSDVVISIDGQLISKNHFFCQKKTNTLFIFDICANPVAIKEVLKEDNKILFSTTGHPLALFAEYISKNSCFIKLEAGSGTVTMGAIDFAYKCGFSKIDIVGADFGYINGKAYTKGTYLDEIYLEKQNKINNSENSFCSLMFRFILEKIDKRKKTSKLLNSYKTSFEEWMKKNNLSFKNTNDVYKLDLNRKEYSKKTSTINFYAINKQLLKEFCLNLEKQNIQQDDFIINTVFKTALLPYIAYLRKKYSLDNKSYTELRKLALDDFVMYTKKI